MSMNEENNEEVSPEAVEASESFDLRSLGIDPMSTPLVDLLKIYREQAGIVNDYATKLKSGVSDPTSVEATIKSNLDRAIKSEEASKSVESVKQYASAVVNQVFAKGYSLLSSRVMLDELKTLVSSMEDEYTYHYNNAVQAKKDELGIKSTPTEAAINAKLACIKLKGTKPGEGLINARIMIAKATGLEDIPSDLYKTGGERNGFNTDVLPRLPRLDVEGATVGTNVTHLTFRFQPTDATDGTVCTETTLNDVAHNVVSRGAYRVTGKDIERKLKSAKLGIGATDTEWSLVFETGTLFGRKA